MQAERRRERYVNYNSLNGIVKALENRYTIIDLRNESCVSGLITNVDYSMNVEMSDVVFYDPRGLPHKFDNFYINSRNIRYVHIPKELPPETLLTSLHEQMRGVFIRPKARAPRVYKKKRAERYQQEILKENYMQPGTSKS